MIYRLVKMGYSWANCDPNPRSSEILGMFQAPQNVGKFHPFKDQIVIDVPGKKQSKMAETRRDFHRKESEIRLHPN